MATLVSLTEFDTWLGGAVASENQLRTDILTRVQQRFERECGRSSVPFVDAALGRVEVRDGTGTCEVFLDYGITTLTAVTLGTDPLAPDETLDVADLVYTAGKRRIVRADGGRFGRFGAPQYVHVTYDAAADLPADVADAIYQQAAAEYRRRGSEETKSETMGPYSVTYATGSGADAVSTWDRVVGTHTRGV